MANPPTAREVTISAPTLTDDETPLAVAREARRIANEAKAETEKTRAAVAGLSADLRRVENKTNGLSETVNEVLRNQDVNKVEILNAVNGAKAAIQSREKVDAEQNALIEKQAKAMEAHTLALNANSELVKAATARAESADTKATGTAEKVEVVERKITDLSAKDAGKIAIGIAAVLTAIGGAITMFAMAVVALLPRVVESKYPLPPPDITATANPVTTVSAPAVVLPPPSPVPLVHLPVSPKAKAPSRIFRLGAFSCAEHRDEHGARSVW